MPKAAKVKKVNESTSSKSLATVAPVNDHVEAPDWPAFTPIIPADSLSLDVVLPHQILTISQFFTSSLCKTYINFLSKLPLVTTPKQTKRGEAVRVNDRFQIQDPVFARRLWVETGLRDVLEDVENKKLLWTENELKNDAKSWGLNPNIRIYRYTPSQHFAKHFDEANTINVGSPPMTRHTIYTLLIYLTGAADGMIGGETVFYADAPYVPLTKKQMRERAGLMPQVIEVAPERGMALLHRHGDECLLHEGKEVKEGVKWVIRSDLVVDI